MYIHTISHPPYILPIHIFLFLHSHVFLHIYPFYPITSINCSCISHPFHLYPKIHPLLSLSISITFYIPPTYIFTLWFSTISTRSHYTFQHFTFALSIIFHITSFIPPLIAFPSPLPCTSHKDPFTLTIPCRTHVDSVYIFPSTLYLICPFHLSTVSHAAVFAAHVPSFPIWSVLHRAHMM